MRYQISFVVDVFTFAPKGESGGNLAFDVSTPEEAADLAKTWIRKRTKYGTPSKIFVTTAKPYQGFSFRFSTLEPLG